jgi:hypothetical protein
MFIDRIFYKFQFDEFIVLNETLRVKAESIWRAKTHVIPFSLPDNKMIHKRLNYLKSVKEAQKISFVVPGNVSSNRVDYKSIIEAFEVYSHEQYELIFLGKVVEWGIIDYANFKKINIVYFNEYVTLDKFDSIFLSTDFAIYKPEIKFNYGETKISGTPYDACRYGVPMINLSTEQFNDFVVEIRHNNLNELLSDLISKNYNYVDCYGMPSIELSKSLLKKLNSFEL